MTRKKPTNHGIPMPKDYAETMRHYIPNIPLAAIRDAWLHNATPLEVLRHMTKGQHAPAPEHQ